VRHGPLLERKGSAPRDLIRVLAAVITRDGSLLIARRPQHKRHGGLWEFPGGKLERNETHLEVARRELCEELGLTVERVGKILFEQQDPGSQFLIQFVEVVATGIPQALEHEAIAWARPIELSRYDLAPTDRAFASALTQSNSLGTGSG
jgi:8-oxo-dGTP diphosphatase